MRPSDVVLFLELTKLFTFILRVRILPNFALGIYRVCIAVTTTCARDVKKRLQTYSRIRRDPRNDLRKDIRCSLDVIWDAIHKMLSAVLGAKTVFFFKFFPMVLPQLL